MLLRQQEDPLRHRRLLVLQHRLKQGLLVTRATTRLLVEALQALVVDLHLVAQARAVDH